MSQHPLGPGGPPFSMSEWPIPPVHGLRGGDITVGGRVMIDPDSPGHMLTFRGESERIGIAQMTHRSNLRIYYGATGDCWGMGT